MMTEPTADEICQCPRCGRLHRHLGTPPAALVHGIERSLRALDRPHRFGHCRDCEFWQVPVSEEPAPDRRPCCKSALSRWCSMAFPGGGTHASDGCGDFEPCATEDHAL